MEGKQRIWLLRQGCHHPSRAGDASHPSTPEGKLNIDRAAQMSPQLGCALCHLVVPEGAGVVVLGRAGTEPGWEQQQSPSCSHSGPSLPALLGRSRSSPAIFVQPNPSKLQTVLDTHLS